MVTRSPDERAARGPILVGAESVIVRANDDAERGVVSVEVEVPRAGRQVGEGEGGGFVRIGADEAVVHGVAGTVTPAGGGVAHDQADGGRRAVRSEKLRVGGGALAEGGRGVPDVSGGL